MKKLTWLLILALPLAIMAALLSPNAYADQGITAVDCDGPLGVMIFGIVTYAIYGIGSVLYVKNYLHSKRMIEVIVVIVCLSIMAAVTPNVLAAMEQHRINQNLEACGKQW